MKGLTRLKDRGRRLEGGVNRSQFKIRRFKLLAYVPKFNPTHLSDESLRSHIPTGDILTLRVIRDDQGLSESQNEAIQALDLPDHMVIN